MNAKKFAATLILTLIITAGISYLGARGDQQDRDNQAGKGTVTSPPDTVVSHEVDPDEEKFEWTRERILLATPMPETGEERQFVFSHESLEKLRDWPASKFDEYVSSPVGRRRAAQEACRWRDLAAMLKRQVDRAAEFLGKPAVTTSNGNTDPELAACDHDQFEARLRNGENKRVFDQLKSWRQSIADLSARLDGLEAEAKKAGKEKDLGAILAGVE
ncbi:MAG: hypothetical protein IPM23_21315 [Candidatus Melainabacteria bacterium]|nr:hypothetical protein [Candidatus Melainabacteria bacterium]